MPKIVFLDIGTLGEVANLHILEQLGEFTSYFYTPPGSTVSLLRDCEIAITNKVVIDRQVMEACPNLQLICIAATGTNNVDLQAAAKRNIQVKNVTGYSTDSVAQATFAMLLQLLNHTSEYDHFVKCGLYALSPIFVHHGPTIFQLCGKTFGIIGLGTIGRKVAQIAEAFGCKVIYYSTSGQNNDQTYQRTKLKQLLTDSDVVSIHAPLNPKTKGLIGYKEISMMKPTALLINTGRGGIVDESGLIRAIDEGKIAGAAIDVLENEPIKKDHPVFNMNNKEKLLITPHIAWAGYEARTLLVEKIAQNIRTWLDQKAQKGVNDKADLQ